MRYERPSPGPGDAARGRFKRPGARISWRSVGVQVVVSSLLAWLFTTAMAGVFVALSGRRFLASFRLSALIMAVVVIGLGIVEAAGGPVPMSMGSEGATRPLGMLSRSQDVLVRPFRAGSRRVREAQDPSGLTALGVAIVLVPQLLLVGSFV
jgi:hypothetical protein